MRRVDYWTDRDAWPFVKPGFLFVPSAFDLVGAEIFGSEWTGGESTSAPNGPRPSAPSVVFEPCAADEDDTLSWRIKDAGRYNQEEHRIAGRLGLTEMQRLAGISHDQWADAVDRWLDANDKEPGIRARIRAVYCQMHLAAAAGDLPFYVADPRDGHMVAIKSADWNFDKTVVYPRFDHCTINLKSEFISSPPPGDALGYQRYLAGLPMFVRQAEIGAALPVIGRRHRGEPELSPAPAQPVPAATTPPVSAPVAIVTPTQAWIAAQPAPAAVLGDGKVKAEIRTLLESAKANSETISQGEVLDALAAKFPGRLRGKRYLEGLERGVYLEVHGVARNVGKRPGK